MRIAYLTAAWKTSPLLIRDPIHQSPLTLTTDTLATQTSVNYPPYFILGSEVTEEQVLSFSSSLSKEGHLFVYGLCYLVIRPKGKGKRGVCVGGGPPKGLSFTSATQLQRNQLSVELSLSLFLTIYCIRFLGLL